MLPVSVLLAPTAAADCTGAGDFGAASGCAAPGGGSGSSATESWPPTSVDWPPQLDSAAGDDTSNGKSDKTASPPIVLPAGQQASPAGGPTPTAEAPKPIVPAGG